MSLFLRIILRLGSSGHYERVDLFLGYIRIRAHVLIGGGFKLP